jgi:hypothetical protein
MDQNDKEYDNDELGVFVLDRECVEMEQMIRWTGWCLITTVILGIGLTIGLLLW